ncbi:3-methyl-2-oxobutanoate hydroxymethyltransferase [Sphingobium sp. 3R8]|uniref:3-methyl-2-oxobutanoate hydroxymethyltransferase n=1 Tax=Sphingobium sp. 3R8 TaxID=2874921 RepID=UPI001CCB4195|nr:3-methyl-2-oxobutanoate hydroxymethyltransferase [Sphingobium sp. 3R8]MBZ9650259.1 3-methyl-2-oxobutanoate hydroxymethyltransferase [Sphingobium sp. 3R8]
MSTQAAPNPVALAARRLSVPAIAARKSSHEPIVMLTAYTARMAELLDAHCDILLVGDSLAQVVYGLPTTLPVSLDMMIAHGAAVVRGSSRALVVIDMPFGSYEEGPRQAFRSAARLLRETGAAAVKLEGGVEMAETISFLQRRGIPVMGHVGLTPQRVNVLGGYRARGQGNAEFSALMDDALAVADAGAFAIVVEAVIETLADSITQGVKCPTIGIGASVRCDGQVLVVDDMLGMFERTAKFVKPFDNLAERITRAAESYAASVRSRQFPEISHVYQAAAADRASSN